MSDPASEMTKAEAEIAHGGDARMPLAGFGRGYFTKMRQDTLRALAEDFARVAAEYGVKVSVRCYPPYGPDDDQPDPLVDVWLDPEGVPHD